MVQLVVPKALSLTLVSSVVVESCVQVLVDSIPPSAYLSLMEGLQRPNPKERRPSLIDRLFDIHPSYLERIRPGRAYRRQCRLSIAHHEPHPNRRHTPHRHHVPGK